MPRGACAELIALRCAVCLLMSRSERQYVRYLREGGGGMGTKRGQSSEESKKTSTQNTYINLVRSVSYQVLQLLLLTAAVCSKERTALRCADELYIAELNDARGALFVIQ